MNRLCIVMLVLFQALYTADDKAVSLKNINDLSDDIKRAEELRQQCIEACADSRDPVDKHFYAQHSQDYYVQLQVLRNRLSEALSKQKEKKRD